MPTQTQQKHHRSSQRKTAYAEEVQTAPSEQTKAAEDAQAVITEAEEVLAKIDTVLFCRDLGGLAVAALEREPLPAAA